MRTEGTMRRVGSNGDMWLYYNDNGQKQASNRRMSESATTRQPVSISTGCCYSSACMPLMRFSHASRPLTFLPIIRHRFSKPAVATWLVVGDSGGRQSTRRRTEALPFYLLCEAAW